MTVCTVNLHGRLGNKFGKQHRLAISTAGEAVRALKQLKGFIDELKKGAYEVIRGNKKTGYRLAIEDVNELKLNDELHIVPRAKGSKNNGGALKIILGVALIGASLFFAPIGAMGFSAAMSQTAFMGLSYGSLATFGLGLALAGASQLMTPKQKPDPSTENQSSFSLGPQNAAAQGVPVPVVVGRCMAGSVLVSAGLDVERIPVGWDPTEGDTAGNEPEWSDQSVVDETGGGFYEDNNW